MKWLTKLIENAVRNVVAPQTSYVMDEQHLQMDQLNYFFVKLMVENRRLADKLRKLDKLELELDSLRDEMEDYVNRTIDTQNEDALRASDTLIPVDMLDTDPTEVYWNAPYDKEWLEERILRTVNDQFDDTVKALVSYEDVSDVVYDAMKRGEFTLDWNLPE